MLTPNKEPTRQEVIGALDNIIRLLPDDVQKQIRDQYVPEVEEIFAPTRDFELYPGDSTYDSVACLLGDVRNDARELLKQLKA